MRPVLDLQHTPGTCCKSKTGHHNQEIGDSSRRTTASSHENGRPWRDRFLRLVIGDLDRSSGNGIRVYETGLGFATRLAGSMSCSCTLLSRSLHSYPQ